ncbi:MAG: GGDEF domain-containing protein [Porticoccaceae bacterium]
MTTPAVDPITSPESASVEALWQVISALSLETDFEKFFRKAAQVAADLVGADAAALVTLNEKKQLTYKFFLGLSPEKQQLFTDFTLSKSQGISGQALRQKKSIFVPNYAAHPQSLDAFIESGMRSNLAIPIIVAGTAIGVLALSWFSKEATQPSDHTISFTETIASQIGLALERTQLEQNLTYRANHDDLTKLPSRGYFISHLEAALDSAKRHDRLIALMVIDLDGFKAVNDQVGHAIGDELLCTVALRLNSVVRTGDVVGRLGGDEFVVLLEYKDWPDEPMVAADRIIEALNIEVPGIKDTLAVSPSIGIAIYPEDASDANTMLKNADLAMYQAKQFGGNQVCLYNSDTAAIVRQRKEMIANVASALKNDDLVIYYQPVVDVTNNHIVAVEALVRWRLPDGSMRDAKDFITTVERHGPRLTLELGRHVLRTAMKQTLMWQQANLSVSVTVNISAREFLEEDFLPSLQSLLLEHTDFPADRLILEVSETGALEDTARASRIMNSCRNLGVRFNIDNFGSGRAALSCLRELPIDFVKIDRSFVQGITESNRDKTVVAAIQTLARAYDAEAIAEGVETKEHLDILLELGCHLMQGYYFSKALSAEQLTEQLKTQHLT